MDTEGRGLSAQDKGPNKLVIILSILLAIAAIGSGVFAYLWMNQSHETATLQETVSSNNKRIETLQKQVSDDAVTKASDTPAATTGETQPAVSGEDDSKLIVAAVGAYQHAYVISEHSKIDIQVRKKELPFANASMSFEEGTGAMCVLKKSDNLWVVLFCGQNPPLQSELDAWGVPSSILSSS